MVYDVVVVGAGAAGYFAAINTAEKNPQLKVLLLESGPRALVKLGLSGGGRCNLTHHCFDPAVLVTKYPRGGRELRGPFSRFQPQNTLHWFNSRGLTTKVESDGRMFPTSDNSQSVIDCLEQEAKRCGVILKLSIKVENIQKHVARYVLHTNKEKIESRALLLATGGGRSGMELARALGHSIQPCAPSLFTFKIKDPRLKELPGVSFKSVGMSLKIDGKKIATEQGPLLITHWGMSGPAIIRLSAWAARELQANQYKAQLKLNFMPHQNEMRQVLKQYSERWASKKIARVPFVELPKRYWQKLLEILEIDPSSQWAQLSREKFNSLLKELSEAEFELQGKGEFKEEFVTCGGVTLKEVNFKTMESKVSPGLYFAGEILDIDGITGGFNFQNAWTTAWVASEAISFSGT